MKRNILALISLLAIAGLTFVQFRLLVIGARLEKQRFDQQALAAQRNIRKELNEESALSKALVDYLRLDEMQRKPQPHLADTLQAFLKEKFAEEGITPQFSFAIVSRQTKDKIEFASNNIRTDDFEFGEYVVPLGNYFSNQLFNEKILHIDVENLFAYLLLELDYLVIPSVLCLLAILTCLALLINILKKEEKLNKIKNDFINNLTHELKTPTFSIALANKLAKENLNKSDLKKTSEFLTIIGRENEKIKNHTEKVLELASLENSDKQLQFQNLDIHPIITEVINEAKLKVEQAGGRLNYFPNAYNTTLKIDSSHFRNLINNLLDNSIKYSDGPPEINVSTSNSSTHFRLSVKDNGIGISPADQKLIFDKFFRGSTGELHQVKGFGLGLSYVLQIVQAHKGKISVESKLGTGATFKIEIPF